MAVYAVYITFTLSCYVLARLTPLGPSNLVRLNFEFLWNFYLFMKSHSCGGIVGVTVGFLLYGAPN